MLLRREGRGLRGGNQGCIPGSSGHQREGEGRGKVVGLGIFVARLDSSKGQHSYLRQEVVIMIMFYFTADRKNINNIFLSRILAFILH